MTKKPNLTEIPGESLLNSDTSDISVGQHTISSEVVDAYEVPRFSPLGWCKFILGLIFLFPVRVILAVLACLLLLILFIIHLPFIGPIDKPQKPFMRKVIRIYAAAWARLLLYINGFWFIKENGRPDRNAQILVSNHQGCFDMLFYLWKFTPSFLVGEFVVDNWFLGPLTRCINAIGVNRKKDGNSTTVVKLLQKRVEDRTHTFPPCLIFVEGATGNGNSLNYFHTGAFIPGVPVQPIVLRYHEKMNRTQWSVRSWVFHYMVSMCQLTQWLEVTYLPVYHPSSAERDHPRVFAYNVKQAMAKVGEFGQTNLRYADRKQYERDRKELKKLKLPIPQPRSRRDMFVYSPEPIIPVAPASYNSHNAVYVSHQPLPNAETLLLIEQMGKTISSSEKGFTGQEEDYTEITESKV
ncbi:putative Lysophospholipid acyltransferase LPEAT1 [Blattamonas nauphoetae]|uniref:Lysophospholipid acyltransferase LPEAT1 n=1 Tax=Blattamonas nauphoetae TaxID=2049346 RepID=A0ABQ9YAH7_9EUKA|nr:putative Lysophospholipid acyltransferase LPEAT1 [Blattamonas nauphoetae]